MDELTLRRAKRGDPAAFEALITPHERMLWRVCWHYTQHTEDARDCAQEAMLKAWRALPDYRGDCSLETWLYRIAASCCLDFLRKKSRRAAESTEQLAEEGGFDPPDPSPQPEEELQRRDERAELQKALAALPDDMRIALTMSAVEGRRYEDIAQVLGVAPGTVKSRISRARVRLSEILSGKREPSPASSVQHCERRTAK